jgi:hypothetical protein
VASTVADVGEALRDAQVDGKRTMLMRIRSEEGTRFVAVQAGQCCRANQTQQGTGGGLVVARIWVPLRIRLPASASKKMGHVSQTGAREGALTLETKNAQA